MPAATDARRQYTKVACPSCRTVYKVPAEDADTFAATLPGACECSTPQPIIGDAALVINDNTTRQHDARLKLLEDGLLKVRGDIAALVASLEAALNRPAPTVTSDVSAQSRFGE